MGLRCPVCGGALDQGGICSSCVSQMQPTVCVCGVCLGRYARWGGLARALKYHKQREIAPLVAGVLAAGIQKAGWPLDGVVAVPTLFWRRLSRGYNQAELLGRSLAMQLSLPYEPILIRVRYMPSQTRMAPERRRNLPQGLFRARGRVRGQWLLVDDVFTTGATFERAREALYKAGVQRVYGAFIAVRDLRALNKQCI